MKTKSFKSPFFHSTSFKSIHKTLLLFLCLAFLTFASKTTAQSPVHFIVDDASLNGCFFPNVDVAIMVEDFSDIISMQYSINWDPNVLTFVNTNSYNLSNLTNSNFGTSQVNSGNLTLSWLDPSFMGVTLVDGQTIFNIRFSPNPLGLPTPVEISNTPLQIEVANSNGIIEYVLTDGQVIFEDNTPPILENCPSDMTVDVSPDCETAEVSWTLPTFTDDCTPPGTLNSTHNPGDPFPVGTTTVTYTAIDNSGNESPSCNFNITVLDPPDPPPFSIECISEVTVKVPPEVDGTIVSGIAPTLLFNCNNEGFTYTLEGSTEGSGVGYPNGIYFNFGTTTVTYTMNNSGLTCSTIVNVIQTDCVPCNDLIYSETFDNGIPNDWTTSGSWRWTGNGKAEGGMYWNDRDPIGSESLGGAALFDSDSLALAGVDFPHNGTLTSPVLDFSTETEVYLKFTEYYRNHDSRTNVEVFGNTGDWEEVFNSDSVTMNVETSYSNMPRIDISNLAAGSSAVRVRFNFTGDKYFWLLDDVEFHSCFPYPETFPSYLADSLITCCVPYDVDENGAAYVPDEVVINWVDLTPDTIKQKLRDSFGVISFIECCNWLELWTVGGVVIPEDTSPGPDGASIGIKSIVKGASAKSEIDEADCNHYLWNELNCCEEVINVQEPSFSLGNSDQIIIAPLDTGIDPHHDEFVDLLYKHIPDNPCFPDDEFGWDFVEDDNSPWDEHCLGHGTHVAGIISKNLRANSNINDCKYRILPIRVCDPNGQSTVYKVGCGMYYAIDKGANVVNLSLGYYADSPIIKGAINESEQNDMIMVAASGNDEINMDGQHQQYPALDPNNNMIAVASVDTISDPPNLDFIISDFSNYSMNYVDIGAPGDSILSSVLNNMYKKKSGTSMATPAVTAAVAIGYRCLDYLGNDVSRIKNDILNNAWQFSSLNNYIHMGKVLNFDAFSGIGCDCYTTSIDEINNLAGSPLAYIYPNPASDLLIIEPNKSGLVNWKIDLLNSFGHQMLSIKETYVEAGIPIEMKINHLPAGLYLINIREGAYNWTIKFIKQQ